MPQNRPFFALCMCTYKIAVFQLKYFNISCTAGLNILDQFNKDESDLAVTFYRSQIGELVKIL